MQSYYQPTPKKWRKIGDACLLLSVSISGMVPGMPISDTGKIWAMLGCNIFGVAGKVITNFFKEEVTSTDSKPE